MMEYTFRTAAAQGYALLSQQYITTDFSGNFWFAGNTLHTCLDYLINAGLADTANGKILEAGYALYTQLRDQDDWWSDDYGWWGDSFVLAISQRNALGYGSAGYNTLFDNLFTAADYCWQKLRNSGSDDSYGVPKDHAAGSANIRGGVYNQPGAVQDPPSMQGRNSVTNEGYWLLSLGLAQLRPGNPNYQQAAVGMWGWVRQFLLFTPTCPNTGGGVGILNTDCLVLERPMGNGVMPTWYWSGDQGLLSRALVVSNAQPPRGLAIVNAAIAKMKDDSGILHENLDFYNNGYLQQFLGDYATGKGIFMRSLAQVNVGPVRPFDQFIIDNAAAVWCNKGTDCNALQFTFNWNRNPKYEPIVLPGGKSDALNYVIMQAAGQDALNAALRISPDTVRTCGS